MASSQSVQQTRDTIRALATELATLSETYEPSAADTFGLESAVVTKAKEIIAAAQTPIEHAMDLTARGVDVTALRNLIFLDVFDTIPTQGGISLNELASATKSAPALLKRLLRPIIGNGIVRQDNVGTYFHTPLSLSLRSSEMSAVLFTCCFDFGIDILCRLPEYLAAKRTPEGIFPEPGSGIESHTHNPTTWRAGQEGKSNYEVLEQDPANMQRLHRLLGSVAHLNPFVGFYDFSKLALPIEDHKTDPGTASTPPRAVFVDVGGGHGYAISHILAAHPDIRPEQCVLQDIGSVIAGAAQGENPALPAAVRLVAHDYFSAQPERGARAYHIRAVAHNLSDANLRRVIAAIKPAMAPDSKLLIADNVIPDRGAQGLSAVMDLMMMSIGGKERTESDFREVVGSAGLKVDHIYRAEGARTYAMVEASLI